MDLKTFRSAILGDSAPEKSSLTWSIMLHHSGKSHEIPVSEFLKVKKDQFKDSLVRSSSAGLELLDLWFVTYQNIGLEIFDAEIILKDE